MKNNIIWIFLSKYKPKTAGYRWKINVKNHYKLNKIYNKLFYIKKKKFNYFKYLYKYKYLYSLIGLKKYYNSFYIGIYKCVNGYIFINKLINGCFLGDIFKNICLPKILIKKNLLGSYNILKNLLIYTMVSNIFLKKNNFQIARSSGTYCQILELKFNYNLALIKMPSNLKQYINIYSYCMIGRNSNINHKYEVYSKASFWYNLKKWPTVRGVAKNPVDHPHGGRTKTCKPEVSPWGWVAKHSH